MGLMVAWSSSIAGLNFVEQRIQIGCFECRSTTEQIKQCRTKAVDIGRRTEILESTARLFG